MTVPETPALPTAIAWLLFVGAEAATCYLIFIAKRPAVQPALNEEAEAEDSVPDGLIQQFTRVRQHDAESFHALIAARFEPGESVAVVHLAFCPPMLNAPKLDAHAIDADDLTVRMVQVESFGARIEVRRSQATSAERTATVEVIGTAELATS